MVDWESIREKSSGSPEKVSKRELWKAIRAKCLGDCVGEGEYAEVRKCEIFDCPLYKYRFGKPPTKIKGIGLDGRILEPENEPEDDDVDLIDEE